MSDFFQYPTKDVTITLPEIVIEKHENIWVVRDDLLPGGTKRRFLYRYLQSQSHVREWVYASPRVGYAQVALAYACRSEERRVGKECRL